MYNQPKKALLVIDIQNDFTSENAKMPVDKAQGDAIIANINRLIDNSVENNLAVIYIGNEYAKFDPLNIFRNFAAIKGTEGAKLDSRLHVINDNYFSKNATSAFVNPKLNAFLQQHAITELYITGLYAEACVMGTIKAALKQNYALTVLTDCIATKNDRRLIKTLEKYKQLNITLEKSV